MEENILVVEDDNYINDMLSKLMVRNGYGVVQAYSGTEAKLQLEHNEFDLVILDLMIPGISGEELLKDIRKNKDMPVIVVSAKIDKEVKIELLKLGADDYITKPFDIDELSARIYSNLRRYKKFPRGQVNSNKIGFKDITMDLDSKEVIVNNIQIILTAREFAILELLLTHPKKVFSKANIFESVWKDEYMGDENTVNVHMSNLRNKLLKANPKEEYIETIWGMGYRLKG